MAALPPSIHHEERFEKPGESSIDSKFSPLNNEFPPQLAGQKRWRTDSSPDTRQEPSLPPLKLDHLDPPNPLENWHCPGCGLPCWRCYSPSSLKTRQSNLQNALASNPGSASEAESMAESMPPPSTPTSTNLSRLSLNEKRRRCEEQGMSYIGPKDKGFQKFILESCGMELEDDIVSDAAALESLGSQSEFPKNRVFMEKNAMELRAITRDFFEYKKRKYDEETLVTICHDSIIPRERFTNSAY